MHSSSLDLYEHLLTLSARQLPLPLEFHSSASTWKTLPESTEPEICLVGRSNVGKSSLLNYLANQKQLARVSSTPGRTRLINLFHAKKCHFWMADLPGYGFAQVSKSEKSEWIPLMNDYFENRPNLKAFIFLFDARRTLNDEDVELFTWLKQKIIPLIVVTKVDKVHKSQKFNIASQLALQLSTTPDSIVFTSASFKQGRDEVCKSLWGILNQQENQDL